VTRPPGLAVVLMRGGTSKGVFVRERDLPPPGAVRDRLLLALMGSPDPMQLDGLGGSHSSTSKVIVVAPSDRDDCDIEYLFAQVGIERALVDYAGNCGNLTTAVGPYAIDEGLVPPREPVTVVRLYNRNTNVRVLAHVPVVDGRASTQGDCVVAGVPGAGAPVVTEYLDPAGAVLGALLPTGHPCDVVYPVGSSPISVSLVDVAGPVAFVRAEDLGLDPAIEPAAANADAALLERLEAIRGACAVLAGLAGDPATARTSSPALPRLALVANSEEADLSLRVTSMQRVHHACPMTVLLCTAAATTVPGTIPRALSQSGRGPVTIDAAQIHQIEGICATSTGPPGGETLWGDRPDGVSSMGGHPRAATARVGGAGGVSDPADTDNRTDTDTDTGTGTGTGTGSRSVRVAHAKGVSEAGVRLDSCGGVASVSVTRTARRLLAGEAYLP
jgi:2-methylaconitate cis-trans-isomerase PrpF